MVDLLYNAGIRIRELEAEVARLKKRLEISHAYDGDGDGQQIPFPSGMEHLDGIACRDETIRQQDEQIVGLKADIARLATASQTTTESAVPQAVVGWAYEFGGEPHLNRNKPQPHPLVRNVRALGYLDAQPAEEDESRGGRDAP